MYVMKSCFLKKLDDEFKNGRFDRISISQLLWAINKDDDVERLIQKYSEETENKFSVSKSELTIIYEELENDYHILIKSFLHYLLSFSEEKKNSKLVDCCKKYLDEFFNNIEFIDGGIPIHNLTTIIKWTFSRFPRYKKEISSILYNRIMNGNIKNIRYLSTTDCFLRDKNLSNIFNESEYNSIYEKYLVSKTNLKYINFYLGVYERYYKYICEHNKKIKKLFASKYYNFVLINIDLIDAYTKQLVLQNIRDIMDETGTFDDEEYNIIDSNLEEANRIVKATLSSHTIPISEEESSKLIEYTSIQEEIYSKISNNEKLIKLMLDLSPIDKEETNKYIEESNEDFSFVQESFLDDEGRVINYKELSTTEIFSLKACAYIKIMINIELYTTINPFYKYFILDNNVIIELKNIFGNNELIEKDRVETVLESFMGLLQQDYKNSVYNIVEELEESLRYFFKNQKMNIYKRNGKRDFIGLGNIFNDNEKNPYKEKLLETIDDNFYFTLKWFLVDNYGYGLRHKIAHRYNSKNLYKNLYSIYIALQILKLYMGFKK